MDDAVGQHGRIWGFVTPVMLAYRLGRGKRRAEPLAQRIEQARRNGSAIGLDLQRWIHVDSRSAVIGSAKGRAGGRRGRGHQAALDCTATRRRSRTASD